MRFLKLLLLLPAALSAQSISVGVLGGVPFNDAVKSVQTGTVTSAYKSTNFTIGPALQVNLPANFRLEVDALYRPSSFSLLSGTTTTGIDSNEWRFPILLGYRFKGIPLLKPYVETGLSFDKLSNISAAAKTIAASNTGELLHSSTASFVVGGGVDVKVPFVRVSGGLRYSHQGSDLFRNLGNPNQAEVLLGIHF